MPLSPKERKARQRKRYAEMGVRRFEMELTDVEYQTVADAAAAAGFVDQTEYLLSLARADLKTRAAVSESCTDCRGWGCFSCCSTEAEIRARSRA